jgi:hypothetical protein
LEQWTYLDWVSNVAVRDRTLQLVLAWLLDIEDPELLKALSRLVDLLTPSMAAEEEPLARRKQELLLNNVSNVGIYYTMNAMNQNDHKIQYCLNVGPG